MLYCSFCCGFPYNTTNTTHLSYQTYNLFLNKLVVFNKLCKYFLPQVIIKTAVFDQSHSPFIQKKKMASLDLEHWMTNLPDELRELPIINLAIPGKKIYSFFI
jgi:hypothetical protein